MNTNSSNHQEKNPNPQGKGGTTEIALLTEIKAISLAAIPAKTIHEISNELFTALFILGSEFSFRPVIEKPYWLYQKEGRFRLSLVSPTEWGGDSFGNAIGQCLLQRDMSWSLELSKEAQQDNRLMQYIEERRRIFDRRMESAQNIEQMLPQYIPSLPFYQRAFASALASSLATSMHKSGIFGLSYSRARSLCLAQVED
ncbi:MAG: DUF2452 domain-containing protein [Gammaproteobacteria bacterium]|nr:DUF2452 domain-containing protein [Gammaproteobacteria bacterium]